MMPSEEMGRVFNRASDLRQAIAQADDTTPLEYKLNLIKILDMIMTIADEAATVFRKVDENL